jgi:hypothetical protein
LSLIGLIELQELIYNWHEPIADKGHIGNELLYLLFIPIGLVAWFFQSFVVLAIWHKNRNGIKVLNMNLLQLTFSFSLLCGFCFGLMVWTPGFGIVDLMQGTLIGLLVSLIYWAVNLSMLRMIDKLALNKRHTT